LCSQSHLQNIGFQKGDVTSAQARHLKQVLPDCYVGIYDPETAPTNTVQ
jgi:hypothetical protein